MILIAGLLLLAVLGTPLFSLLAFAALTGFLDAFSSHGWEAAAFDALGRRGLNSPALAAVPMAVFAARLLGATVVGARLRGLAARVLGAAGTHAVWQSAATCTFALMCCAVLAGLPLRALALSAAAVLCTSVAGAALLLRADDVQPAPASAEGRRAVLDALVLGGALVAFLSGLFTSSEAAACVVAYAVVVETAAGRARLLLAATPRLVRASTMLCGAWLLIMVTSLSVLAWLEQTARGAAYTELLQGATAYVLAVCCVLGAEIVRASWPAVERAAAAYLGVPYGAPMPAARRLYVGVLLTLVAVCAWFPAVTTWLPQALGVALTAPS